MGPFAAAFMNRFGVRRVAVVALSLIFAGVLGSFAMTQLWQLVLLWGFVVGFGTGLTAMVLGATVATRWFVARRGLVIGLLTASTATGQLVFLPLLAELTRTLGWRSALTVVLVLLGVAALIVLALMRDRPSDVGLAPFGAPAGTVPAAPAGPASLSAMLASPLLALRDAARTPHLLDAVRHLFRLRRQHQRPGADPFRLAVRRLRPGTRRRRRHARRHRRLRFRRHRGSGWLSDRFDSRTLLFWYYGLRGLSLIYLPFTSFSFYELSVFAVFYGLDWSPPCHPR